MTADPDINPQDSEYLKRSDTRGYLRVQEFLREWDPIGLRKMGMVKPLEDEYNGYALGVMERLGRDDSVELLMEHLSWLANQYMGVNFNENRARTLVLELCDWWNAWEAQLDQT